MTGGAAQKAPQDVPRPSFDGRTPVANHHCRGGDMVGNDAQGNIRLLALAVFRAGYDGNLVCDVINVSTSKILSNALTDDGETLQAHTCVDIFLLQLRIITAAVA